MGRDVGGGLICKDLWGFRPAPPVGYGKATEKVPVLKPE
jgi:hypothetical protein